MSPPVWKNQTEIEILMSNPARITVGGMLQLKCPAKGNPLPRITWLHNGEPLERGKGYLTKSNVLTVGCRDSLIRQFNRNQMFRLDAETDSPTSCPIYRIVLRGRFGTQACWIFTFCKTGGMLVYNANDST